MTRRSEWPVTPCQLPRRGRMRRGSHGGAEKPCVGVDRRAPARVGFVHRIGGISRCRPRPREGDAPVTAGSHRPIGRDHNRVEPGDAIGIAIRVPGEHLRVVAELLAPSVPADLVLGRSGPVTIYPTIGRDTLNGRPVSHRWVNVIADPPVGVPADDGIGGLACIGAQSSAINRMWWRHGLGRVPGRLWVALDRISWRAHVRIATSGGTLTANAAFQAVGEAWEALPQHYYLLGRSPAVVLVGDEWGNTTRRVGVSRVPRARRQRRVRGICRARPRSRLGLRAWGCVIIGSYIGSAMHAPHHFGSRGQAGKIHARRRRRGFWPTSNRRARRTTTAYERRWLSGGRLVECPEGWARHHATMWRAARG